MKIEKLFVTQNSVRNVERLPDMAAYVRKKGYFNREALDSHAVSKMNWKDRKDGKQPRVSPLIQIYRLSDPSGVEPTRDYLHDGHHRVTAILMGGRRYVRRDEYELHHWTYNDYAQPNFSYMYVTPYDPRTHCRLEDTCSFKREARRLAEQDQEAALAYIWANVDQFRVKRWISTVKELRDRAKHDLRLISEMG